MKKIRLTKGYEAIVDDEDFEEVLKYKWHCHIVKRASCTLVYARNDNKGLLSRFLMKPESKVMQVDHRNHNTLDYRRFNLRVCSQSENQRNRRPQPNKTGYKGVNVFGFNKDGQAFSRGRLQCDGRFFYGCPRLHCILAAKDYDDLAKKHFGEFACPNFPFSIKREHIARMILSTNGRIFKITFIKRTGEQEERTIFGRVGVKKRLKNIGCRYSPEKAKLVVIFDMQEREYKAIPVEGIHAFYFAGKKYRVDW